MFCFRITEGNIFAAESDAKYFVTAHLFIININPCLKRSSGEVTVTHFSDVLSLAFMLLFRVLLQSEIPSGMCAKLRTVAASNNRDHPTRSLYYCLLAPHTYIFVLRAHPVRGESHNQRNATGEVATVARGKRIRTGFLHVLQ